MTPRSIRMAGFIAGFFVVVFWAAPGATTSATLVPHRGIYSIGLERAEAGSGVVGVEGAMIYKFTEGCDGWTVENQTLMRFDYEEGRSLDSSWSYVSWESKDGLRYRFRVNQTRNGKPGEMFRGTATTPGDGGAGQAHFSQPSRFEVTLPPGTVFPTRHLLALIEAGRSGGLNFNRFMFDGTSPDNPYEVNAVITPLRGAVSGQAAKGPLPEFQLHIQYRDDGIAEALLQDYGDITLKLHLSKVEALSRPEC